MKSHSTPPPQLKSTEMHTLTPIVTQTQGTLTQGTVTPEDTGTNQCSQIPLPASSEKLQTTQHTTSETVPTPKSGILNTGSTCKPKEALGDSDLTTYIQPTPVAPTSAASKPPTGVVTYRRQLHYTTGLKGSKRCIPAAKGSIHKQMKRKGPFKNYSTKQSAESLPRTEQSIGQSGIGTGPETSDGESNASSSNGSTRKRRELSMQKIHICKAGSTCASSCMTALPWNISINQLKRCYPPKPVLHFLAEIVPKYQERLQKKWRGLESLLSQQQLKDLMEKEEIWRQNRNMEEEKKEQMWKENMKLEEEKKEQMWKENMKMEEEMKAEKSLEMEEKSLNIFRSKDKSQDAQSAQIQAKQSVTIDGEPSSKQAGVCTDICLFISISVTLFYTCKTIVNIINERESPLTSFTLHQSKYFFP